MVMIGYHYTTEQRYKKIQKVGMYPMLESINIPELIIDYTKKGCIWVFKHRMTPISNLGMVSEVASRHKSTKIVLLEIKYDNSKSAKWLFEKDTGEIIKLTHSCKVGKTTFLGHVAQPIDIILEMIPPDDIKLINSWDLLELIK